MSRSSCAVELAKSIDSMGDGSFVEDMLAASSFFRLN